MSIDGGGEPRGILQSLRRLASTALALVITRGELAAVELAEARERIARWAVAALLGAVLMLAALVSVSLLVAAVFWESYRWQAIGALALAYAVAGTWLLLKVMREVRAAPPLLSATLAELARDREALAAGREAGS
jgi:uncharacterized membrane protein YqjE